MTWGNRDEEVEGGVCPRSADEEATATAGAACGAPIPILPTKATVRVSSPLQVEG